MTSSPPHEPLSPEEHRHAAETALLQSAVSRATAQLKATRGHVAQAAQALIAERKALAKDQARALRRHRRAAVRLKLTALGLWSAFFGSRLAFIVAASLWFWVLVVAWLGRILGKLLLVGMVCYLGYVLWQLL